MEGYIKHKIQTVENGWIVKTTIDGRESTSVVEKDSEKGDFTLVDALYNIGLENYMHECLMEAVITDKSENIEIILKGDKGPF